MKPNTNENRNHYNRGKWNKRRTPVAVIPAIFVSLALFGLVGYYFTTEMNRPVEAYREPVPLVRDENAAAEDATFAVPAEEEAVAEGYYPIGMMMIDSARLEYVDETMELFVPRMNLKCVIYGSTDEDTLWNGPGLFDYAQLPGPMEQNANVSIAGHRDMGNNEFLYIDKIVEGDKIYIRYLDVLYTYEFSESFITDQYNWDPMRVREYPCITLQSCDPIGGDRAAQDRIFVIGKLIGVEAGAGFPEASAADYAEGEIPEGMAGGETEEGSGADLTDTSELDLETVTM